VDDLELPPPYHAALEHAAEIRALGRCVVGVVIAISRPHALPSAGAWESWSERRDLNSGPPDCHGVSANSVILQDNSHDWRGSFRRLASNKQASALSLWRTPSPGRSVLITTVHNIRMPGHFSPRESRRLIAETAADG
jgi:hypothetical protein